MHQKRRVKPNKKAVRSFPLSRKSSAWFVLSLCWAPFFNVEMGIACVTRVMDEWLNAECAGWSLNDLESVVDYWKLWCKRFWKHVHTPIKVRQRMKVDKLLQWMILWMFKLPLELIANGWTNPIIVNVYQVFLLSLVMKQPSHGLKQIKRYLC